MKRDYGLALSLSPRAWNRQERHGEGCGVCRRLQHPTPTQTVVRMGWGWGQCSVFWHLIYALEVGLGCQGV